MQSNITKIHPHKYVLTWEFNKSYGVSGSEIEKLIYVTAACNV